MNTKLDKDLNQEILIAETASEELPDEVLENITGGFSLNFTKITYNVISQRGNIEIDNQLTSLSNKAGPL